MKNNRFIILISALFLILVIYKAYIGEDRGTPHIYRFVTKSLNAKELIRKEGRFFFQTIPIEAVSFTQKNEELEKKVSHNPDIPGRFAPIKNNFRRVELYSSSILPSGKIIVSGGINSTGVSVPGDEDSAYAPLKDTWFVDKGKQSVRGPDLLYARKMHKSISLNDGSILIVGGLDKHEDFVKEIEIKKPDSKDFKKLGNLKKGRTYHSLVQINKNEVLVISGKTSVDQCDSGLRLTSTLEILNLKSGTCEIIGQLHEARADSDAILLGSNRVLIFGGIVKDVVSDRDSSVVELFERN